MAIKKTVAASRPRAKSANRALPLSAPAAAPVQDTDPLSLPVAVSAAKAVTAPAGPAKAPVPAARKPAAKRAGARPAPMGAPVAAPVAAVALPKGPDMEDLSAAGQEMIETYAICGSIAAKGVESLGKEVVSFARSSAQAQFALTEALMQATTMQEAIEAQSEFTRESFGNMTAEFAKLTGMSVELTQQLMKPIQARLDETTRSLLRPLAA